MASKRARLAAARAAKRIPVAGTAVVLLPIAEAASLAFPSLDSIANFENWKRFFQELGINFGGYDAVNKVSRINDAIATYTPIVIYLLARRFAGKHISRVLRPLGLRF